MKRRLILPLGPLLAAGLLVPTAGAAPPPLPATLADVAFMAGHWIGGDPGDLSEEVWTAPEGDSMVGMWRYVVLRIRHFDPKLVAREEKDRAVGLFLVANGPREAAFEGPEYSGKGNVRLTYRRGDDDSLTGILEMDGSKQEFHFRRR